MGDAGVGKTSLIKALKPHFNPTLRPCAARASSTTSEGPNGSDETGQQQQQAVRRHAVIVWTANSTEPMRQYAQRYRGTAMAIGGRHVPMIIVCNQTDVQPCPLPEMNSMRGTKIPALAVSAHRGTYIGALWLLIERAIVSSQPPSPALSPVPPRRAASSAVTGATPAPATTSPLRQRPQRSAGADAGKEDPHKPPSTSPPRLSISGTAPKAPSPASVLQTAAAAYDGYTHHGHAGAGGEAEAAEQAVSLGFEHSACDVTALPPYAAANAAVATAA